MKVKTILLAVTTAFLFSCSSVIDKTEVPEQVIKVFSSKYSDVKDVVWEKVEDTFKASFKLDEKDTTVALNNKGEWVKIKSDEEQDDEDVETILHTLPLN